jgi:Zn-finger nucleic acid-binding protein
LANGRVLKLVLDRCPTCRGVWLDAGALEQMQDTIGEGLTRALVQGMVIPG